MIPEIDKNPMKTWRLGLNPGNRGVGIWYVYHRTQSKRYFEHSFNDSEIEILNFLVKELISPSKGRRLMREGKIMKVQEKLGNAVWDKLGTRLVMQKYKWRISPMLVQAGREDMEDDVEGIFIKWGLGLKIEERDKKHKDYSWYSHGFTIPQIKMVTWLFNELCSGSHVRDADVVTSRLGNIVYYKPKDLI